MTEILTQPTPPVQTAPPSTALRRALEQRFHERDLLRPFRRARYDMGDALDLHVTGVMPANTGRVVAEVQKFVGGGFAGQVYRVVLREVLPDNGPLAGLTIGQRYAIKILKPPSGFACLFRNALYTLGYQGHFRAEVHPASVRVGVLWQKLIRRAAARRFGRDDAICDTFATFHDPELRSFGEINEWVDGRMWKFEVDDQLFTRWKFKGDPPREVNAAEYVYKKRFMSGLVELLHEMGAPEFARQYEWWTCKSQPNVLKRVRAEHAPEAGLTAIDFRAGLALLPFLPMSPADVWLILRGLAQGRIVQFDRANMPRLKRFVETHADDFADLKPVVDEICEKEPIHRRSLPDVTNHHVRLLTDGSLRRSIREGTITVWRNQGRVDDEHAERLRRRRWLFALLYCLAWIPVLGHLVLKLWGHAAYRRHLGRCLSSWDYLLRAMNASRIETVIRWHRQERLSDERALKLPDRPVRYWAQLILCGWMPPAWHRMATEPSFAWEVLRSRFRFMLDFFWNPAFREQWLIEQVHLGRDEGMLTPEEADKIAHQVKDPYIQKYLRCTAVHLCTVPVTQVVMVIVGTAVAAYMMTVRQAGWHEAVIAGTAAATLIQLLPISPGSLARGLFVVYLMIRERDVRNYYIAAPISFIHVIGYLAFPLQMVAHDPALARFMAGRWATSAVRFVPVFGERGGLPEHMVFDLFFNVPLSFRRRMKEQPATTMLFFLVLAALLVYPAVVLVTLAQAGYVYLRG